MFAPEVTKNSAIYRFPAATARCSKSWSFAIFAMIALFYLFSTLVQSKIYLNSADEHLFIMYFDTLFYILLWKKSFKDAGIY